MGCGSTALLILVLYILYKTAPGFLLTFTIIVVAGGVIGLALYLKNCEDEDSLNEPEGSPPIPRPRRKRCPRCNGLGHIARYSHVEGGVCFDCDGKGSVPDLESLGITFTISDGYDDDDDEDDED